MTIESWSPTSNSSGKTVDTQLLQRFLNIANNNQLDDLNEVLSDEEKQQSGIMHADQAAWEKAVKMLDNDQLIALIRFFTLAEEQLSGWHAGSESPVIAINQVLKSRGHKLDRDLLMWIRQNSTNRFIPNGAIL